MGTEAPSPVADAALVALARSMPPIRGALLATLDGYPVAHHLPDRDPASTAAIAASSCGLGERSPSSRVTAR